MSKFSGDKKHWTSYLWNLETKLKNYLVPKVPRFIETYHLTYMTLLWCVWVLLFSYIASKNSLVWFSFVSLFIFLQYITDLLDGEVGRRRNTGLVKWWYFMDHFLDFLFWCSIVIGYTFIIPQTIIKIWDIDLTFFIFPIEINYYYLMLYFFGIFIWFMVVSFLSFSATNKFQIAYWGFWPTEMRLLFIIFNTSLVFLPKFTYMYIIPIALIFWSIWLIFLVYKTQKELWKLDMREKRN
jgi:phosphatidylglycerophosphate synthase